MDGAMARGLSTGQNAALWYGCRLGVLTYDERFGMPHPRVDIPVDDIGSFVAGVRVPAQELMFNGIPLGRTGETHCHISLPVTSRTALSRE